MLHTPFLGLCLLIVNPFLLSDSNSKDFDKIQEGQEKDMLISFSWILEDKILKYQELIQIYNLT